MNKLKVELIIGLIILVSLISGCENLEEKYLKNQPENNILDVVTLKEANKILNFKLVTPKYVPEFVNLITVGIPKNQSGIYNTFNKEICKKGDYEFNLVTLSYLKLEKEGYVSRERIQISERPNEVYFLPNISNNIMVINGYEALYDEGISLDGEHFFEAIWYSEKLKMIFHVHSKFFNEYLTKDEIIKVIESLE